MFENIKSNFSSSFDGLISSISEKIENNEEKVIDNPPKLSEITLFSTCEAAETCDSIEYTDEISENKDNKSLKNSDLKSELAKIEDFPQNGKFYSTLNNYYLLKEGNIEYNGETVSPELIISAIEKQFNESEKDVQNAFDNQGIIRKGISSINNYIGLGTTQDDVMKELNYKKHEIQQLRHSINHGPSFISNFKGLTGKDFTKEAIVQLLAYDKLNQCEEENPNININSNNGKIDIGKNVNTIINVVNKSYNGDKNSLALKNDKQLKKTINAYKETQTNIKNGVIGLATGFVSAAAIGAAPFTGGASLLAGVGAGAGLSASVNALDSIYDNNSDNSLDFNYSLKDSVKDASIGALNGLTVGLGGKIIGMGSAFIKSKFTNSALQKTIAPIIDKNVNKTALNITGKAANTVAANFVDGAVYSGGEYVVDTEFDKNKKFESDKLLNATIEGGTASAVLGTALKGLSKAIKSDESKYFRKFLKNGASIEDAKNIIQHCDSKQLKQINECLSSGKECKINLDIDNFETQVRLDKNGKLTFSQMDIYELGDLGIYKSITNVKDIDKKFDFINEIKIGKRLDPSMENYKVKVGNKDVEVKFDNNIVSEQWIKEKKTSSSNIIFTDSMRKNLDEAFESMNKRGLNIPDRIYFTQLFDVHKITGGEFSPVNDSAIFLNSKFLMHEGLLKNTIFHESSHMADYRHFDLKMRDVEINNFDIENSSINYKKTSVPKKDIQRLISSYSLSMPQEFIAEVSTLITKGILCKTKDGHYIMKTNDLGRYKNLDFKETDFDVKKDGKILDDIMEIYNHLAKGKIVKPETV